VLLLTEAPDRPAYITWGRRTEVILVHSRQFYFVLRNSGSVSVSDLKSGPGLEETRILPKDNLEVPKRSWRIKRKKGEISPKYYHRHYLHTNKKFWKEKIAYFPYITVFYLKYNQLLPLQKANLCLWPDFKKSCV
jgi:hypothetical protein